MVKEDMKLEGARDECILKGQVEPSDWLWPILKGSAPEVKKREV